MKTETDQFSFLLKPSAIPGGGVGVFAAHDIAKGTRLMLMSDERDYRLVRKEEIPSEFLSLCIARDDDMYACPINFSNPWIVWFMNHSDSPNTEWRKEENRHYALQDIRVGEELFTDYNGFGEPEDRKENYYIKK